MENLTYVACTNIKQPDLNSHIYNMTLVYLGYGEGTFTREIIDEHLEDVLKIMNTNNEADVASIKKKLYYFYNL